MAAMRTVGVRLRMETGQYKRDADEAAKATERVGKSGQKAKADLDDLAMGLGIVGAGLVAVAGVAVYAAMQFDKQMSEVGAVAGATAGELDQLRQAALDAGAATVFSAREAAQAEAELAKAGIATADILGGALTGSLSLASAGSLDLATSAEIAAAAMNTFGLGGQDVEHIADVLAAAANKSSAGVEDLGMGLQQVGLIAAQVGFSLEETVGLLAAFADRGLKGSDGATSLKTALMRLAAPTGEAAGALDRLGISLYDSNGNMVDAANIAGQLERGLKDLSPAQRNAALNTIFGSDAIRAANVLYAEGEAGIRDYIAAVDDQGAAARVAAAKLDNLSGDVEALKGSLETLFIEGGSGGVSGGLRILTQAATGLVNALGQLPGPVSTGVTALAGIGGVALLATAGMIKFRSAVGPALESLAAMGPAGTRAARGLELTGKWAMRATGVLVGLQVAGALVGSMLEKDLNPQLEAATLGLGLWDGKTKLAGESARLFGDDAEKLGDHLQILSQNGFAEGVVAVDNWAANLMGMQGPVDDAKASVSAFDAALSELVKRGQQEQAADVLAAAAARANISIEDALSVLPTYAGALEVAEKETGTLAATTIDLERAQIGAVESGETLADLWDRLNGAVKTADEEMLDAVQATQAITEAFEENGNAVKGNTEAALKNRIALEAGAREAYEAADAYLVNGGTAEGAAKILDTFRKRNEDAAVAAGGNRDKVKALNDQLYRMPAKVTTKVSVITSLDMSTLPDFVRSSLGMRWGGITVRAQDGYLRDAAIYHPTTPARYAFAEPATGGEAFVPRRGDYGRSMQILSQAAGWYGADVVPQGGWYGGGNAGPQQVSVTVSPAPGASRDVMAAVVRGLQFDVRTKAGGDVQKRIGRTGR